MISRCVAILFVAVAAQAVSLEHTDVTTNAQATQVAKSPFGATVLAQLQEKITQGTPAKELRDIIETIRARLNDAGEEDSEQFKEYARQCADEKTQLEKDISDTERKISDKKDEIGDKEAEIKQYVDQIAAYDDKIVRDGLAIDAIDRQINANEYEWKIDHQLFQNRSKDTKLVLTALDEIEKIVSESTLKELQDETARDYAPSDIYTGLIEKLANKVSDPTVVSFVQATALAMTQMDKGDVDQLNKLIKKLRVDLEKYAEELVSDDAANKKAYEDKRAALFAEREAAEKTKADDQATRARIVARKGEAQQELKKLDSDLEQLQGFLAALEAEYTAQQQKCDDLEAAFVVRRKDREDELNTLKQIEQIIAEKLEGMENHIVANISSSVGGGN